MSHYPFRKTGVAQALLTVQQKIELEQLRAENDRLKTELEEAQRAIEREKEFSDTNLRQLTEELSTLRSQYEFQCRELVEKQKYILQLERSQQAAVPAWRTIETAPKDGTEILLASWGGDIGVCFWRDDAVMCGWTWGLGKSFGGATHWMPLPAAPETTK